MEGAYDGDTIEELLRQKKLSLEQTIQICRAHESARHQREEIKGSRDALNVTSAYKAQKKQNRPIAARKPVAHESQRTCKRCGNTHNSNPGKCPAYNKTCNKCKKLGHFASQCHTKHTGLNELKQPNEMVAANQQSYSIYAM